MPSKWNTEKFFMALLLVAGPDPDPHIGVPTTAYDLWWDEVHAALRDFKVPDKSIYTVRENYFKWLGERDMAWRPPRPVNLPVKEDEHG